jgi:hypothetical protein
MTDRNDAGGWADKPGASLASDGPLWLLESRTVRGCERCAKAHPIGIPLLRISRFVIPANAGIQLSLLIALLTHLAVTGAEQRRRSVRLHRTGASDGARARDQEHGNRGAAAGPLLISGPVVQRRRAADKARSVARRKRASFPPVQGCAVGKPRRPDANPRAARARNVGSPFFWLLFFGEALRRRSGANAEGGPEGAKGRRPGVKKSDSAAEGRRNGRERFGKARFASSHRNQTTRPMTQEETKNRARDERLDVSSKLPSRTATSTTPNSPADSAPRRPSAAPADPHRSTSTRRCGPRPGLPERSAPGTAPR